ncbi:DUF7853 family protein [Natronobacterium texcoconense]|uniref:Uncharacterized protein n=1 Tax=Natronobacterium texcoconense TaxID=1095778 RepID=A0A1H0ZSY9_NATTX|nr:hypothetical protein [Natronobacterium texcoconense]SDQ30543.1 hypothetical protein SAMN04489842_0421 [Natronobacterium texcoconense]
MSSQPPETETFEVTLSREERWVVHHVLTDCIDDAVDEDESPPSWVLDVFETVEEREKSDVLTGPEARRLHEELTSYLDDSETPERDVEHGAAVAERLETALE